jgi:transcriptional regulator with XRE-family HTH domain
VSGEQSVVGPVGDVLRGNLLRLRLRGGLTKVAVSERVRLLGRSIPPLAVARIEAGTRRVDADDLVALAAVFGVAAGRLLEAPGACAQCFGMPPAGFACRECGADIVPSEPSEVRSGGRRRNAVTDDHLRSVAGIYRCAVESGEAPTWAVAAAFDGSHSTAARWVGMARARGFLGGTTPGRAGEQR